MSASNNGQLTAKFEFECNGWGCIDLISILVRKYDLEFVWRDSGGFWIFEYMHAKVSGKYDNIIKFRELASKCFNVTW